MSFELTEDQPNACAKGTHHNACDCREHKLAVLTKAALDATLAVHPTAAEELVTMRTPAVRHNL